MEPRWIISPDQRHWTELAAFGTVASSTAEAIAATRRLPTNWQELRTSQLINPRLLLAPIVNPGKVIGIAGNYVEHATEVGLPPSDELRLFAKFPSAITGPHASVTARAKVTHQLDYEGELAVVIGTHLDIEQELANPMAAVFGFAVANDVTARDVQHDGNQLTYAKSMDTFLPIGPWITVRTEHTPPLSERSIRTLVNGDEVQHAHLGQMVRDVPNLIHDITRSISLDPGDVILTGSPRGSGVGMDPPEYLKNQDIVSVRITGFGHITNTIHIV